MAEPKTIPPQFQAQPTAIKSYDWTDIADGTGNSTFYLVKLRDNTGDIYKLIPSAIEGEFVNNGWSSTTYVNFDSSALVSPRTVKGWAYFSGIVNWVATNGTITATLYHYDGTNETAIGTECTTGTKEGDWKFCLGFNVSRKHFKKGDIIRLKVKTSAAAFYLVLDPSGTNPAKLSIPFEIDI